MFGITLLLVALLGIYGTYGQINGAATTSPPWYPAPNGGTAASWAEAYKKAHALVSQMTLLEKVNITTGTGWAMGPCVGNTGPVARLGFPSLCLQDGPLGVRFADKITAFPAGITIGGTFDKNLMRLRGQALGQEFKGKGVHIALGPAMGPVGKFPAGGRNWEGFGSDPALQGIGAYETILGIQGEGVIATAKHYIGNEQEHFRQGREAMSTNIDDRTLHEIYMWPFQDSMKAGVGSVMCSYQKVNNSAACQNSWLQNGVLKDELGFQGFIMSDWGAQMSGVASVLAGMDMTMPGDGVDWDQRNSLLGPNLTQAVLNSSVPIDRVDDMTTRIVAAWYKLGQDKGMVEPNFSSWTKNTTGNIYFGSYEPPVGIVNKHVDVRANHYQLARKIAADATALLKNDRNTLPLKKPKKVGIYGEDAAFPAGGPNVCSDRGCNQGTLLMGWGSGSVDLEDGVTEPLAQIKKRVESYGGKVESITDNSKTTEIAASAKKQDVCIVFVNADAGEGYITWEDNVGDRANLDTQKNGDNVILAVANNCQNTVVVVHTVGPIIMEKWVRKHQVRSIVWAHLPGIAAGDAITDVLFGDVNPSGKLPYTIGKSLKDYGPEAQVLYTANSSPWPQQDFKDGLFIDYRYFDREGIEPRYEFGYGLSYTTFKYGPITKTQKGSMAPLPAARPPQEVEAPEFNSTVPPAEDALFPKGFKKINRMIYPNLENLDGAKPGPYPYPEGYDTPGPKSQAGGAQGGNPALWEVLYEVSFELKNSGKAAGAEVAQLYIEPPQTSGIEFPKRQLRQFEKVFLQPGEKKTVKFQLTRRDLSYWDVVRQNWVIPQPGLGINVGASSRKIHGRGWIYTEKGGY